jgi:molybdenum cofactor cytidylyltransferase
LSKGASRPSLVEAFGLKHGDLVSIVGGGGKTSLMFALASQWPGPAISTTTTRIFRNQIEIAPSALSIGPGADVDSLALEILDENLKLNQHCLVFGEITGDKAHGVPLNVPLVLLERSMAEIALVESDGSRMRPCKAPADHEPAIPDGVTLVIPTIGIDAINSSVSAAAHRPELVGRLTQLSVDDVLTTEALATLLTHPEGGLKNIPDDARIIPFINKVESTDQLLAARDIACRALGEERITKVILGKLHEVRQVREVHQRVSAVVLAAGKSDRMGSVKQLLPWGDTTVLGQTLVNLQASSVNEIIVVVGFQADAVNAVAQKYSVPTLFNPEYETGEMLSSLKMAVNQLPSNRSAVLVILADQPMVSPEIIDQLLERFWQGNSELVAPIYQGERGNPVLIGRSFFQELLDLSPGMAPRHLLQRHDNELVLVDVKSPAVVQDLDLPEDYERWRPAS